MSDLQIKIESTVKKIKCNDYGDYIAIDVSDKRVFEKYSTLLDNCNKISDRYSADTKDLLVVPDNESEEEQRDRILKVCRTDVNYINEIIVQLESVFGKDAVRKVCRENYENDPDYIPDESILVDFIEAMLPVMEKLYGERYQRNKAKYNSNYRGKHTK